MELMRELRVGKLDSSNVGVEFTNIESQGTLHYVNS